MEFFWNNNNLDGSEMEGRQQIKSGLDDSLHVRCIRTLFGINVVV